MFDRDEERNPCLVKRSHLFGICKTSRCWMFKVNAILRFWLLLFFSTEYEYSCGGLLDANRKF